MPSPPAVITGCHLRQRLYRTRLHHHLGRTGNKNRHLAIVVKDQSEKIGGTHRRTSSGVISRPQKKKKKRAINEPYRQPSGETCGRKGRRGVDYTACGLESTHEQVARRDLSRRTRWLAKKRVDAGRVEVRRARRDTCRCSGFR